jgi:hypothetical protein
MVFELAVIVREGFDVTTREMVCVLEHIAFEPVTL